MNVLDNLPDDELFQIPLVINDDNIEEYTDRGFKYVPTSILDEYKPNWDEWSAIREFVQNSLDETGEFDIVYDSDSHISYIVDQGKGIDYKDLFLGRQKGATAEEVHCLRGVFGEGMKLAIIPLLNQGSRVLIRSTGIDYHFCYIQQETSKGVWKHIGILTKPNSVTEGTAIAIAGTDATVYLDRFAPTLAEVNPDAIILTAKNDPYYDCKIRQAYNLPGRIYVRDIFVQDLDAHFGYNFWFDHTVDALGSDRLELKNNRVAKPEILMLLRADAHGNDGLWIRELIRRLPNTDNKYENLEWSVLDDNDIYTLKFDEETAMAIHRAIVELVGTDEYSWSRDTPEQKVLEHRRIKDLRDYLPDMRSQLVAHSLIKDPKKLRDSRELTTNVISVTPEKINATSSDGFAERIAEEVEQIHDVMKEWLRKLNLYDVSLHFYTGKFEHEERVAGFYRPSDKTIYIKADTLPRSSLRVFIHEAAHAYCHIQNYGEKCGDLEQGFEDALEYVGQFMILLTHDDDGHELMTRFLDSTGHLDMHEDEFRGILTRILLGETDDSPIESLEDDLGVNIREPINKEDRQRIVKAVELIRSGNVLHPKDIVSILHGYQPGRNAYDLHWSTNEDIVKDIKILRGIFDEFPERLNAPFPSGDYNADNEYRRFFINWVNIANEVPPFKRRARRSLDNALLMLEHRDPTARVGALEELSQMMNGRGVYPDGTDFKDIRAGTRMRHIDRVCKPLLSAAEEYARQTKNESAVIGRVGMKIIDIAGTHAYISGCDEAIETLLVMLGSQSMYDRKDVIYKLKDALEVSSEYPQFYRAELKIQRNVQRIIGAALMDMPEEIDQYGVESLLYILSEFAKAVGYDDEDIAAAMSETPGIDNVLGQCKDYTREKWEKLMKEPL